MTTEKINKLYMSINDSMKGWVENIVLYIHSFELWIEQLKIDTDKTSPKQLLITFIQIIFGFIRRAITVISWSSDITTSYNYYISRLVAGILALVVIFTIYISTSIDNDIIVEDEELNENIAIDDITACTMGKGSCAKKYGNKFEYIHSMDDKLSISSNDIIEASKQFYRTQRMKISIFKSSALIWMTVLILIIKIGLLIWYYGNKLSKPKTDKNKL